MRIFTSYLLLLGLTAVVPAQLHAQSTRNIKAKFTWEISNVQSTSRMRISMHIPETIESVQKVNSVEYSIEPHETYIKNGETYAVYNFTKGNIPERIEIEADMVIYKHGLSSQKLRKKSDPVQELTGYLVDEEDIEVSDPAVKSLADSLKGKTDDMTIRNICSYLARNINYKSRQSESAKATLKSKTGNCVAHSNLMAALCRANGIPARIAVGYLFNSDFLPGWDGEIGHVWIEVWLPQFGWVAFEPTIQYNNLDSIQWKSMPANYIYLSRDTNNSDIKSMYNYSWSGERPRVNGYFSVQ